MWYYRSRCQLDIELVIDELVQRLDILWLLSNLSDGKNQKQEPAQELQIKQQILVWYYVDLLLFSVAV